MVIHRALSSQGTIFRSVSRSGELPTPCHSSLRSARVYPCYGRASAIPVMDFTALTAALAREPLAVSRHRRAAWPGVTRGAAAQPYSLLSFNDIRCIV
jgi:hypothetical protein